MFALARTSSQKDNVGGGENPIGGILLAPVAKKGMSRKVTSVKTSYKIVKRYSITVAHYLVQYRSIPFDGCSSGFLQPK